MAFSNYDNVLKSIQSTNIMLADHVKLNQPIIEIDWNTRVMKLPPEYQSFLGVEHDHQADTVYFCADRYFDSVDLSTMTCVIEYINASKEGRICPVLDIDTTTDPNKIYFGWKLGKGATKTAGPIRFVVRFYTIDPNKDIYVYNLSTQVCTANILKGIASPNIGAEEEDLSVDQVEELLARIALLEDKAVRWQELYITH